MKRLSLRKTPRILGRALLLLGMVAGSAGAGQAQQTELGQGAPSIQTVVHLRLGATTVGKLTAEMAKQTGLNIEADPALAPHRLVVQMDGVRAEAAIKTLAELNGWEIANPDPTHYRVRPVAVPKPAAIGDIPRAFQAALPIDFRRYLGIELAEEDLPQDPALRRRVLKARLNYLPDGDTKRQFTLRSKQLLDSATESLIEELIPLLADGEEYLSVRLSAEQKERLLDWLVLENLNLLDPDLILGRFRSFQRDWPSAEVRLKRTMLMIESTTPVAVGQRREGFGAHIQALSPPAPPP